MEASIVNRRNVLIGAAAAVATVRWPRALAQVDVNQLTAGTWLDQVKAQHAAIASVLTNLINSATAGDVSSTTVQSNLSTLSYLLTAHSVAEENTLYPVLVFKGLTINATDLYVQQQFQKVGNFEIDLRTTLGTSNADWLRQLQNLQAAFLEHAQQNEEGNVYPKLQGKLTSDQGTALDAQFKASFLVVKTP